MYGQMTAGSWIYIGTQGILQGTYETFAAVADKRFGGTLAGTLALTGGCGGKGGGPPPPGTPQARWCPVGAPHWARLCPRGGSPCLSAGGGRPGSPGRGG